MEKKTTIYDIAMALGVTVSTVSRALSGFPAISETTREAVVQMAKKLNYTPNRLASALKSGKSHIIGVIVPSIQAQFFASIIHSIEEGLKESGYRVILYQSNESVANERNGVKTLLEAQVDGIMASISLETNDTAHFQEIIKQNKPLILFDRIAENLKVPTVTLDDFKAGYLATQHLIDQGYRKIAYITTTHQVKVFADRLAGYKAALAANQLPLIKHHVVFGSLSVDGGRLGAAQLVRHAQRPDAIIGADDFTALGALETLKEAGYSPAQIGVVGYANEAFAAYITPSLSTINQHPNQMGLECASMFLKMISQKNPYQNISEVVLQPAVVQRQSTQR